MPRLVTFEGQDFSFPDDATDDEVLQMVEQATKPAETLDVLKAVPETVQLGQAKQAEGLRKFAEDVGGYIGIAGMPLRLGAQFLAKRSAENVKEAEAAAKEVTPENMSTIQKGLLSGGASVISNVVPALTGAGVATALTRGGAAAIPALTAAAEAGLANMAVGQGAEEYGEQRKQFEPWRAGLHAAVTTAAEYLPEKWAVTRLADAIGGKSAVGRAAVEFLVKDLVGEELTTITEWINSKLSREPNTTLGDLWEQIKETAVATAVSGPVQSGAMRIGGAAIQAVTPQGTKDLNQPLPPSGIEEITPGPGVAPTPGQPGTAAANDAPINEEKKKLIADSELPLIGMTTETPQFQELPFEMRLELLRKSYADLQNNSFQDDALTRIQRKKDFQARLASVDAELKLNPDSRSFLLSTDEAMGLNIPNLDVTLEQTVNDYATLTPEQAQERELRRELKEEQPWQGENIEDVPVDPNDPSKGTIGNAFNFTGNANPLADQASEFVKPTKELLSLKPVLRSTNPDLIGLPYEGALQLAQPSDIIYLAEPGEENAGNAAEMMDLLRTVKDKFLPNSPIFIGRVPTPEEKIGSKAWKIAGHNAYAMMMPYASSALDVNAQLTQMGTGTADFNKLQMDPSATDRVDTLLHEFVHILHFAHWNSATAQEKANVAKEYHDDLRYALSANIEDALRRLYSAGTADWLIAKAKAAGLDTKKTKFNTKKALKALDMEGTKYWLNFTEWMAHKGVKYFQTRGGVAQENVPFFRRWIQKMAALYQHYTAQFAGAPPAFTQWMNNIALRESQALGIATEQDIEQMKADMRAAGMEPALVDLLSTVKGNQRDVMKQLLMQRQQQQVVVASQDAYDNKLKEIGKVFFSQKSREDFVKSFANDELAQTLLNSAEFANPDTFNRGQFAHSYFANILATGDILVARTNGVDSRGFMMRFTGPDGRKVFATFRPANNKLTIEAYDFDNASVGVAMELAVATHAMQVLAQQGEEHVNISDLSFDVIRVLSSGTVSADINHLEMPFWSYNTPVQPQSVARTEEEVPAAPINPASLAQNLHALAKKVKSPWLSSASNSLGTFNWLFDKALGAYELINLNANVPGMQENREALRNRMMYRHQWLSPANERVQEWGYEIGKEQAAKLGKLLFDEAEQKVHFSTRQRDPNNPVNWVFMMDPKVAQARGIDQKTQELYSKVRNDFRLFAEEWHKTALWEFARGELSDVTQGAIYRLLQEPGNINQVQQIVDMEIQSIADPVKMQRLTGTAKDINDQFRNWTDTPYMPYTRFGRYGTLVRDGQTGKTLYFSGHDTIAEAREKANDLKGTMGQHAISITFLEDKVFELAGLPPAVLEAMRNKLQLDPQQQEVFSAVLQQLSLANAFKNRAAEKKGIEGFSLDALRAYSDYFRRGAAFMARVKSNPQLADANRKLEKYIQQVEAQVGDQETQNLHKLHQWFSEHHQYLNGPGSEYGQLKSTVAMFHFAFNASSAVMNLTQVPLVTVPYLSARYGEKSTIKELAKAYKDGLNLWSKKGVLAPDEQALYEYALKSGFLDESQATVLGQMADGQALSRATLTGWSQKSIGAVNSYGMWMFSKAEYVNRFTTLMAAYRLARSPNFHGKFDQTAFDFARTTVEDTQNEYAQENRPKIMRGGGGVILQFMHYTTHMLFMQLGGDKAWWRLLIAQLAAGGLLGLPFAEDLMNMAKFVGRKVFNKDVEPELFLREHLKELGVNQDLVARGLFNDIFGFDLSKRVSMGEVLPGLRAVGSNRKFDQVIYDAIGDVAGPGAALIINALKFISEDDHTAWNAVRRILPTVAKNVGNAAQAFNEGVVKDPSGAKVFEPDVWDIIGMAAGFTPKEMSEHYLKGTLNGEQASFWVNRKQALLEMFSHIVLERGKDREAMSDFMKRLESYNKDAPGKMTLNGDQLRAAVKGRLMAQARKEAGLGTTRGMETEALETQRILEE